MLYIDYSLLLRFDNLITATQMHEGEETQQSVVVAIEETFLVWLMLSFFLIIHIFLFAKLHFIISRRHAEMFLEDGRREPSLHVRTL